MNPIEKKEKKENIKNLNYEENYKTQNKNKNFKCEQCNKSYSVKDSLKVHVITIHEKKLDFACTEPNCSKRYINKYKLECHKLTHTGEKPFSCPKCIKSFITKGNLTSHQKRHDKDLLKYFCLYCGKSYASKGNRNNHYKIVHLKEKHYGCSICNQHFGRSSSLQTHLILHNNKKPFNCPIEGCVKNYAQKGNLLHHINVKHSTLNASEPLSKIISQIKCTSLILNDQIETKSDDKEALTLFSKSHNPDMNEQPKTLIDQRSDLNTIKDNENTVYDNYKEEDYCLKNSTINSVNSMSPYFIRFPSDHFIDYEEDNVFE